MSVRLAEELLVELDDLRIVVALTHCLTLVLRVQSLRSLLLVGIKDIVILIGKEARPYVRLAAAVDASARASHDLDELIFALAFLDLIQKNLCALHAGCDRDVHGRSVDVDGGFADPCLVAADCGELDGIMLLAGELEVNSTKGSFHNAAGDAEDDACTGVIAHDVSIPVFVRKTVEEDTASADHAGKLSGGDDSIDIRDTVNLLLLTFLLKLLGGAGHDGDHEDILRIDIMLLCPPGLDDSALHLVRGLAGGQMRQKIAVEVLCIVDPAR